MISIDGISKSFGKVQAVDGFSMQAKDGEITGLLGPNGAGKTTALRCIYGLTQPDAGSIEVGGLQVADNLTEVRRSLGIFTDKFGLYDRLSTYEQIRYFAELNGLRGAQADSATKEWIRRLAMEDIADRRSQGFSQGQRMKVSLARALVHGPQHMVLDEPTRGLDVMSTRNLRALLRELRSDGKCILFSSHVMAEVAELCDRVIIIRDGKACAEGTPEQLCELAGETQLEEAFLKLIGTEEGVAA